MRPQAAAPERSRYVSEKRLGLSLGVSEELMLKLRRAQDQVSQSLGRPATLEDTLEQMTTFYLEHKDPLEKARRVIAKKGVLKNDTQETDTQENDTLNKQFTGTVGRAPIPKAIEHQVRLRDQNQCQAPKAAGGICGSRRSIDLHHITPVSQGGTNAPENLVVLCRAHHRLEHAP